MKRLLSLFMSVAVVFGCMIFSITAETANTAAYAGGDGSKATPFEISTADQLVYFAQQINAGIGNDQYYRLTADIDLGGTYGTQTVDGIAYFIAINHKTWTAAGTTDHPFKGNFDGRNHKIENLVTAGGAYVGLFGVIEGATVQNVTIASGLITTAGQEAASNPVASYAGAIAACVKASENNTVMNCSNYATVFVQSTQTSAGGGIIGDVGSRAVTIGIDRCYNMADIIAHTGSKNARLGGIIAYTAGKTCTVTVTNCLNTGNLTVLASQDNNGTRVGGIAGGLNGKTITVSNCFSSGTATVPSASPKAFAGALFGATNTSYTFSDLYAADPSKVAGNAAIVASPLISMKNGAAIRLVTGSYGIRFVSDVSAGAIRTVNAIKDEGTEIKYGTIIIPTASLTGELTSEALAAAGKVQNTDYIVIEAQNGIRTDEEGNVTIYAAMVEEAGKTYDAAMKFSAASYMEYTVNGVVYRTYTAYTADHNSRSMKEVAEAALADTTVSFSDAQIQILNGYIGG